MTLRPLRLLLLGIVAVFVAIIATLFWVLQTESGGRWLWTRAVNALPDNLAATSFEGSLSNGVTLSGLRYNDEGLQADVALLRWSVDVDWIGSVIIINGLTASDILVQLGPSQASNEPAPSIADVLSSLQLPVTVRLQDANVADAEIRAADGSTLVALDSLSLDAEWGERMIIERVEYAYGSMQAKASADLELISPFTVQASGEFSAGDAPRLSGMPADISASFNGNARRIAIDVSSRAPLASVRGTVIDPLDDLQLDLIVTADQFGLPPGLVDPSLVLDKLQLRVTGRIDDYLVEGNTLLLSEFASPISASTSLRGSLRAVDISRLALSSDEIEATARGNLGWHEQLTATASVEMQRVDPRRWVVDWPDGQALKGQAQLALSESRLEVAGLQLAHSASSAALRADGVIDTQSGVVDIDLSWSDLQWPLAPAAAQVDSRSASLKITGAPDDWTLDGEAALGAADLPQGRFVLDGTGGMDAFKMSISDSEVLGGRIVGDIAVSLRDERSWSAQLVSRDIRITPFLPDWPGQISVDLSAEGLFEPFAVDVKISSLNGQVRGRAVSAAGRIQLTREQIRFEKFLARSGGTQLQLDGDWNEAGGVSFSFASSSLTDILPDVAGSAMADGKLTAGSDWPQLQLKVSANALRWQDWNISSLSVTNTPGGADAPFGLVLSAQDVGFADQSFESVELKVAGAPDDHQLQAAAQQFERELHIALDGALSNWQQSADANWKGQLTALRVAGRDELGLALRDSADVEISRDAASMATSCFDTSQGGALCGSARYNSNGQYAAHIELTELPLNLLRNVTGTDLQFTQLLNGAVDIETGPRGRPSGSGRVDMTPGQISNDFDERLTLRTRAGYAAFKLDNGQLLAGELSLPFSDAAEIAGTFRALDIALGQDSPVSGQLTAVIRDLGVGARILPQIDEAGGSLDADFRVDGTLAAPQFAGGFSVRDGRVEYDPLGLKLSQIQVDSKILPGNRIELQSSFRAGDGIGQITSSADYLQGLSAGFEVSLTGQNLRLIDLPDLRAVVEPEIKVGLRGDDISINGKLKIPQARIASINFINTGVGESDDVVYVGAAQPDGESAEQVTSPLNYSGSVILELGDDVAIDLDVAEARVRGSSTYRWEGIALPQATGSFTVSGKFEAYGQLLEIVEGSIRYANVPASNPQLRIRAEREIFGNSQVRRAGVLVSGTALRPKLEVYTTPATSPYRAVTLLVTGSDFNYEQGVGAVDVGTYIAPRLYASYGIGLFDRENVISVRYDLGKGFGVKATSGKRAAGFDISYTIER